MHQLLFQKYYSSYDSFFFFNFIHLKFFSPPLFSFFLWWHGNFHISGWSSKQLQLNLYSPKSNCCPSVGHLKWMLPMGEALLWVFIFRWENRFQQIMSSFTQLGSDKAEIQTQVCNFLSKISKDDITLPFPILVILNLLHRH